MDKIICPKCQSRNTYFRMGVKTHMCRNCGNSFKLDFKSPETLPKPLAVDPTPSPEVQ